MAETIYTDNVVIDGTQDETQLDVQGHSTQTNSLQTWKDSSGTTLAEVLGDGRLHVGEDLGAETDDALIEVHRDSSSTRPKRGLGTLGKIGGTLDSIVQWIFHELRLTGSGDVDAQHSALRVQLTNESTGAFTANGELRAGDFEVVNADGNTPQAGKAVGVRAAVHNTSTGIVDQAIGIEVDVQDENVTTPVDTLIGIKINDVEDGNDNFAVYTGKGTVYLGDVVELEPQADDPAAPSGNRFRLYPKPDGKLYAQSSTTIFDLTQGGGHDIGDLKLSWRRTDLANRWLRCDGRTIGSATSGGTARANADIEALFVHLWENSNDAELPIQDSSGTPTTRGASAAADFAANKRLLLPDLRGRVAAMLDDPLGSDAAARITAAWADNLGGFGGAEGHTLTMSELPSHTHTQEAHNHGLGSHTHTIANHSHEVANHVHQVGQHAHGLNGHTHAIPNHAHTIPNHTHSLNNHTHTTPSHSHSISPNPHSHTYFTVTGSAQTHTGVWYGPGPAAGNQSTSNVSLTVGGSGNLATGGPSNNSTSSAGGGNTGSVINQVTGTPSVANTANSAAFNTGGASPGTSSVGLTTNAASGNTGDATPTINAAGDGQAHTNIQPTMTVGIYLIYTGN